MQKTGLQIFCNASQRCVAVICNALDVADEEVRPTLWWNSAMQTALRIFSAMTQIALQNISASDVHKQCCVAEFSAMNVHKQCCVAEFSARTCTNSRHVAEIICNAICVAENICNG